MESIVKEGQASLNRTPDLLPVLKEVGVVDSGGQGLLFVYEGFLAELKGEKVSERVNLPSMNDLVERGTSQVCTGLHEHGRYRIRLLYGIYGAIRRGKKSFDEETFRQDLSEYGDSSLSSVMRSWPKSISTRRSREMS